MVGMHVYSMYRAYVAWKRPISLKSQELRELFSHLQELLIYGSNCYNLILAPFTSPRGFSAYNF